MTPARRIPVRLWFVVGALALAVGAAVLLRDVLGVEWSTGSVRELVRGFGVWGPLVLVGLLTFRFFILIPSQILLTAGGVLFGVLAGTLYGALGLTLAAVVKYGIVRWTGVEALRAQLPARFRGAAALSRSRTGATALALVSCYPVGPIGFVHLVAATTGMALLVFTTAIGAGSLVRAATFAYFGSTLLEGERVLLGSALILVVAGLPLLHPRSRGWIRQSFLREKPTGDGASGG